MQARWEQLTQCVFYKERNNLMHYIYPIYKRGHESHRQPFATFIVSPQSTTPKTLRFFKGVWGWSATTSNSSCAVLAARRDLISEDSMTNTRCKCKGKIGSFIIQICYLDSCTGGWKWVLCWKATLPWILQPQPGRVNRQVNCWFLPYS